MTELSANNSGGGEAASSELASNTSQGDELDTGTNTEGEGAEGTPEPETEEVEHEGQKYKIPKALKGALLMQSDYTKKTQELADKGRSHEERETAFKQTEAQHREHLQDVGKVYALNDKVQNWEKTFKSPEWAAFERNPETAPQAQAWFRQYLMDKDDLGKASGELQQKVSQRTLDEQRSSAKRIEEGHAAVARDVKDWNPETFGKVKDFGVREFGLKAEEIASVSDPRLLKIIHRAYLGDLAIKKLAASEKAAAAEEVKPLSTVTGNARSQPGPRDSDSTDAWMRKRNAQTNPRKTA